MNANRLSKSFFVTPGGDENWIGIASLGSILTPWYVEHPCKQVKTFFENILVDPVQRILHLYNKSRNYVSYLSLREGLMYYLKNMGSTCVIELYRLRCRSSISTNSAFRTTFFRSWN